MLSGFLTVHSYLGSDTWSIYSLIGGCWRYPYDTIQQPQNSPWALLLSVLAFEHIDVLVRAS